MQVAGRAFVNSLEEELCQEPGELAPELGPAKPRAKTMPLKNVRWDDADEGEQH